MQVMSHQQAVPKVEVDPAGRADRQPAVRGAMRRGQRGFTLVELLITMAIALVLLMLAVPSFKNMTLSNRLTTTANEIVNAVNVARMEAIKRNSSTQFCSNSTTANSSKGLGAACGSEAGAVYGITDGLPDQLLAGTGGIVAPIQLNGNVTALNFTPQGLARKVGANTPYGDLVADICTSQMSSGNHREIRMIGGSILTTTTTSGACPSP